MHGRDATFFYYFPVVLLGTLPWCAYLWKTMKEGGVHWRGLFEKSDYRFILLWMGFIFLFYSISSSKLIPYLGPVFLPLAVVFGQIFRLAEDKFSKRPITSRSIYLLPVFYNLCY